MADIEVRGYANKPQRREGARGGFTTFTLSEKQKERDGTFTRNFYDCMYFGDAPLQDGSYVTVKGWFTTRKYKDKNGNDRMGLSIKIQDEGLTLAPPLDGAKSPPPGLPEPDGDEDAIPF